MLIVRSEMLVVRSEMLVLRSEMLVVRSEMLIVDSPLRKCVQNLDTLHSGSARAAQIGCRRAFRA